MRTYALRRLLLFVPTLVGASLLIFVLMRLVPGDIAEILVYQTGSEASAVQQKQIAQIRRELASTVRWPCNTSPGCATPSAATSAFLTASGGR